MIINTSTALPRRDLNGVYEEFPNKETFVGDLIFPEFEVPSAQGKGARLPAEEALGLHQTKRGTKGPYQRVDDKLEDFDYVTDEHGLESELSDRERQLYKNYMMYDAVVAVRLRARILRRREYNIASAVINTTNFPIATNTGHDASTPWTSSSATPIADVNQGVRGIYDRSGLRPDTLLINWRIQRELSRCTELLDRLRYTRVPETPLSSDELATAFGLKRVIVADVPYNSAIQGQALVVGDIWNKEYGFLCKTYDGPDISEPCIGRCWRYTEDEGPLGEVLMEQYRDEKVRGDVLRARFGYGVGLLDTRVGYLMSGLYS